MDVLEQCPLFGTLEATRHYGAWERSELFANAIKTAIQLGDDAAAFLNAERSRQEGFRQIVRGLASLDHPLSAEDQERIERILDEELAGRNSQGPPYGESPTAGARSRGERSFQQSEATESDFERTFEHITAHASAHVLSISEITAAIPHGSAVVAYYAVAETLYAFCLLSGGESSSQQLAGTTRDLENLLVYKYVDPRTNKMESKPRLHDPPQARKLCFQLYDLLLKPLLPQLNEVTRLYVIPTKPLFGCPAGDGNPLTGVPFAALRDDCNRLLIAPDGHFPHGIAYLTCATPRPAPGATTVSCNRPDTVFHMADEFPKRPWGPGVRVIEGDLSPEEILRKLATSRLAFFYAHGYSHPVAPLRSGLSRTPTNGSDNPILTGKDCLSTAPYGQATVAVVSCLTAVMHAEAAQVSGGEEMLGFSWPLLLHAETVIGCLWETPINDYDAFSEFIRASAEKSATLNESVDPIQATVDWQRERIARCKRPRNPWQEAYHWAWPMVWTTLCAARTVPPGGEYQEEGD
jgi:hypothetical protein